MTLRLIGPARHRWHHDCQRAEADPFVRLRAVDE
jgi:hypothetical protein